ncbi:hypothetical protein PR202_ga09455 [Eleusine coracana subsp. coracana]|uniref:Uncharacterized protein n=1 Tax=Eleusine coracana subsp. coracana TaxID=191504 RepID=A0AAV5C369_ELECO|nr:hypothetical protein PR202_ga09455 [Eleusine coracana subsp. coracana]
MCHPGLPPGCSVTRRRDRQAGASWPHRQSQPWHGRRRQRSTPSRTTSACARPRRTAAPSGAGGIAAATSGGDGARDDWDAVMARRRHR